MKAITGFRTFGIIHQRLQRCCNDDLHTQDHRSETHRAKLLPWMTALINFPLLLSVNHCDKFVQTTQPLPSVNIIHYFLLDNGKCIDSGCSMMADIYRGDGGKSPRFLNFGTSCV